MLIALICLDIRIPVCRRYKIKEDTGATCVYRSDRDAYVHRTHTSPTTPYAHTHPGPHPCTPPVTPSGRATFPSGQNTVSNPKAPDLSLGDLSDPILRIFMILGHFWTAFYGSESFLLADPCPDFLVLAVSVNPLDTCR